MELKEKLEVSKNQPGNNEDGFIALMKKYDIPLTKENYLELVYNGDVPSELEAEEIAALPEMFQDNNEIENDGQMGLV
ncbi:MAG: hypothetical protein Unbinned2189contig1000_39 [Prokaryotic dsDNA virus sp.]|nr:MAG: hypothetical protein Unbinned2189contig1000_39 [Prokaryotic dsDNA virus sp.]